MTYHTEEAQDDGDGERGIWHIMEYPKGKYLEAKIVGMTTYKSYALKICEALNLLEKTRQDRVC